MYGRKINGELRKAELEQARLGFIHFLRRKRFSAQFIASHGDDLFATAALEYSRKIAEGVEINSPPGWLITCAWRRTKNLLEAQSRSPRIVSTEKGEALTDELSQSPEEEALDEDRFRKVQEAIEQLSVEERRLLELAYFEGMAVREAARELHWHPSKAQRCHEAARRRLHELLGVESVDELEIEVGLAAYLSVVAGSSSGVQIRPGIEAVVEAAGRGATDLWTRAQDLARRFVSGGGAEPSATAALGGGAGRAAGVCATAAVACIAATGVVGPGVGGLIGGGGKAQPLKAQDVATAPSAPLSRPSVTPPRPREAGGASSAGGESPSTGATSATGQRSRKATRAVRSQSVESAAGPLPDEGASAPVESAPAEASTPTADGSGGGSTSSSPTQVANEQFGP
jgi:RNA polymerase sigma factor (sigma-70 family)